MYLFSHSAFLLKRSHCNFHHMIPLIFEDIISLHDFIQRKSVGYHTSGINPSFGDQARMSSQALASTPPVLKVRFLPYISGSGSVCASSYNATMHTIPFGRAAFQAS